MLKFDGTYNVGQLAELLHQRRAIANAMWALEEEMELFESLGEEAPAELQNTLRTVKAAYCCAADQVEMCEYALAAQDDR